MFRIILDNRDYRYFWFVNLGSNTAIWMQTMLFGILVSQLSSSALTNSLVHVAATLPFFLLCFIAGIIGDRFNQYWVMLICQCALSITAVACATIGYLGFFNTFNLIVITFIFASIMSFRMPTSVACVASLVRVDQVAYASVLNNLCFNISRSLGPALVGVLLLVVTAPTIFILSTVIFLLPVIYFYRYRKKKSLTVSRTKKLEGISQYIKEKYFIYCCLDIMIIMFSSSAVLALLPYFVKYNLGGDEIAQSNYMACIGLGAFSTIFVLPVLIKRFSRQQNVLICYGLTIFSTLSFLFYKYEDEWVIAINYFICGLAWSMSISLINAMIQERYRGEIAARVIACIFYDDVHRTSGRKLVFWRDI